METITIKRYNGPDIKFEGELIASVSTSPDNGTSDFSGSPGRWNELELYKTAGGKYVAVLIAMTLWEDESDSYKAAVCDTTNDVIEFFGSWWLARELYEAAGIEAVETVD